MTELTLTQDRLLLKPIIKKSAIMLPEEEKADFYTVAQVAPQVSGIEIGETVVLSKYAGQELTIDGEKYVMVKQESVIAKIIDEE